jgi:hypothetical protein
MRDEGFVLRWCEEASLEKHLAIAGDVRLPIQVLWEMIVRRVNLQRAV